MNDHNNQPKNWWAPVWRGLVVDATARHYRNIDGAIWLFIYLIVHADRKTGYLIRRQQTIAEDMGVSPDTVRKWLGRLRQAGYVKTVHTGRALKIYVQRWKPLLAGDRPASNNRSERDGGHTQTGITGAGSKFIHR